MTKSLISMLGLALLISLAFPRDAFAYLDPGSGSLIFQTIVATLAGVAYGVRVYWHRITGWFGRRAPQEPAAPSESESPARSAD